MLDGLQAVKITDSQIIKPFDCGDLDLNDFLMSDANNYQKQLLAVTYVVENDLQTAGFFSLLTDKISVNDTESKNQWRKNFRDTLPQNKRFSSYPAIKIGRLGIDLNFQGKGLGTEIMNFIKAMILNENRYGCRYITVDAYRQSLKYYERNDFRYLTSTDANEDTRLMYFDLSSLLIDPTI
jgi:GNAT superfamily N-acetyltransferase